MEIVVFGIGKFFQNRKEILKEHPAKIVAFIDNDQTLWNTLVDGVRVMPPYEVTTLSCDAIVLMSVQADAMKEQLLSYGILKSQIWNWNQFCKHVKTGQWQFYGEHCSGIPRKKILLIGTTLNYDGSTVALFHAAEALVSLGNQVVIAAPDGNPEFINEMVEKGYNMAICPCLPYVHQAEREWGKQFDLILLNTFPLLAAVSELCKICPVLWWIHECTNFYGSVLNEYEEYARVESFMHAYICAVSDSARKNFNTYYPERVDAIMPYGIPDRYDPVKSHNERTDKIVFAVIGNLCTRKAQKDFVNAVKQLNENDRDKAEFWLIGGLRDETYTEEVRRMIQGNPDIKLCGEMTREEIELAYEKIDVVVCCSQEEILPVVVTEGLMFRKVCIMADNSGMTQYVEHKKNGFIYETGNIDALSYNIEYVIDNLENLDHVRTEARKTYETYFKMDIFEKRLEQVVESAIKKFESSKQKETK